jgi:septation ring formation regulator EzrA
VGAPEKPLSPIWAPHVAKPKCGHPVLALLLLALAAPHLLPKTREELERALEEVREERRRLVALLESLAAERALAKGDLEAARRLEAHLADLREVLASLREGRR